MYKKRKWQLSRSILINTVLLSIILSLTPLVKVGGEEQTSKNNIIWQRVHNVRGFCTTSALLPLPDKGYRVVGRTGWQEDPNNNKSWKSEWLILDINQLGDQDKLLEFPTKSNQNEIKDAINIGDNLFAIGGILGWIAKVDATGTLVYSNRLGEKGMEIMPYVIVPSNNNQFLIGGTLTNWIDRKPHCDAWLSRIDSEGKIIWQKSFDHGQDEFTYALTMTNDGGCFLAITSGKYNKFGQGSSGLWLIRCDSTGNKIAEIFIPDARIQPAGRKYITNCGNGFVVSYTNSQLPSIAQAPYNKGPSFNTVIACFDNKMQLLWQKELKPTTSFGTSLVATTPDGSLLIVGGKEKGVSITKLNIQGESISDTILSLKGIFNPVDMVVSEETITIMGSYFVLPEPGETAQTKMREDIDKFIVIQIEY